MRMAPVSQETSPLYSRESWVAILYEPVRFEMEKVTNSRKRAMSSHDKALISPLDSREQLQGCSLFEHISILVRPQRLHCQAGWWTLNA